MLKQANPTITIIGAGLAGCYLAILLAKRGFPVEIYEREDFEDKKLSKRSFNLTFYDRGVRAFKAARIWQPVKKRLIRLQGTVFHPAYSEAVFSKHDYKGKPYFAIGRQTLLNIFLKEAAKYSSINFHFNTSLVSIDRINKEIVVRKGKETLRISCEVVIGADGVNSVVREAILDEKTANLKKEYAPWTYKEIHFEPKLAKKLDLRIAALHLWARKNILLTAFPNRDKSFTAMLTLPTDKNSGFAELTAPQSIKAFLKNNFHGLLPAFDHFCNSIINNPEGKLISVTTSPWYYSDFIAIVGDAAHGSLPYFGQGTSAAFEDCLDLVKIIEQNKNDWKKIFSLYQQNRKKHADVLVRLSAKNINRFLRHREADFEAIHDRLEFMLHTLFPKSWNPPLYVMMANDKAQFADILQKHKDQRQKSLFTGVTLAALMITLLVASKVTFQKYRSSILLR